VVLAADTEPLEILLHIPLLCEDKVSDFSARFSFAFNVSSLRIAHMYLFPTKLHLGVRVVSAVQLSHALFSLRRAPSCKPKF